MRHGLVTSDNVFFLQLQKINDEQKTKIRKTERALKVAEVLQLVLIKLILCQILRMVLMCFCFLNFVRRK
jgi:hypothetical protein